MDKDEILIEQTLAGNKNAFGEIINRHKNEIIRTAYRFCGDFKEAEDIAQDVFIKAYTNLSKFKKEASFSTWLYRITYNTACNYTRLKRKNPVSYETFKDKNINSSRHLIDKTDNPVDKAAKKEEEKMIQEALNKLPLKLKSAIVFREYEGLSYREISKVLGCSIGTVESRIARARQKLKVLLSPYLAIKGERL